MVATSYFAAARSAFAAARSATVPLHCLPNSSSRTANSLTAVSTSSLKVLISTSCSSAVPWHFSTALSSCKISLSAVERSCFSFADSPINPSICSSCSPNTPFSKCSSTTAFAASSAVSSTSGNVHFFSCNSRHSFVVNFMKLMFCFTTLRNLATSSTSCCIDIFSLFMTLISSSSSVTRCLRFTSLHSFSCARASSGSVAPKLPQTLQ
mmetsp:Transcript_24278/g.37091  ORF Transcript_24278/g.37091 Transcript_24278/m.37091 type:complete len:209 (-) Transcript_24278:631-1257(-)